MTILDELTSDLNWRESELGSLKILLQKQDLTKTQKEVLLRAAWAMLYAHYEGFSKFCLTVFYNEAAKRSSDCVTLPGRTKTVALERHIKRLRSLPSHDMLGEMEALSNYLKKTKPSFPDVDTKSNLWPSVMQELLLDADILIDVIGAHTVKLKTLVSRRNDIAHGQQNFINEFNYYLTYEDAVYDVMYHLIFSIDDRLNQAPYAS